MNVPSSLLLAAVALLPLACASARPAASRFANGRVPESELHQVATGGVRSAFASRVAARTRVRTPFPTIESTDEALHRALQATALRPAPDTYVAAAREYLRLGITDRAADHLSSAVALDPENAEAYDLRARLWRDWGLPGEGLGDAYRAAYFAPRSAAPQNTLGTLLHRLGYHQGAAARYWRALALDPAAAYALNNLCAVALDEGEAARALAACRQAVALDAALIPVARNLQAAKDLLVAEKPNHDRN
jgi:Tfp pilus assembly protein PilF